jgi:hypothetical protein
MRPTLRSALFVLLALAPLGCRYRDGEGGGDFEFSFFISGSWSGDIQDSRCGSGQVTFVFVQTGDRISGSWYVFFSGRTTDGCWDPEARDGRLSGPLTGSVSGSGVTFTMQRPQGSAGCGFVQPILLTGTWTGSRLTGSYSGVSCSANVTGSVNTRR